MIKEFSHLIMRRVFIFLGGDNLVMYPTSCEYFRYIGHQELTEEDRRDARRIREGFERCFLPPGVKLKPRLETQD